MAFQREWGTVTVTSLLEQVQVPATPRPTVVDVVEPVAAAAELLPSEENLVRMCVVVDVGAGTTDIGLFLSLVPDSDSPVRSKLYRIGQPVSVFKAGNVVDGIVLKLLEGCAKKPSTTALADVRARIRGIKETLFRDGFIQELGCDVHLKDLQSHPEAKAMAAAIRAEFLRLVQDNAAEIVRWLDKPVHSVNRLDVVMAGGGGSIDFVVRAIDKPVPIGHRTVQVKLTIPGDRAGINTFGASRGRMAVALGGASNDYDNLVHEQPKLTTIRRGSY
jgi:molecular chaperone HscA